VKPDVLVVWPNRPKAMAELESAYTLHHLWQAPDREALLAEVGPRVRAIVTTGERGASAELIDRLPALEIAACFGVGYDGIDQEACRRRGVPITNTPDVLTEDVADMGLALTLCVMRRIVEGDRWVRAGRWVKEGAMPLGSTPRGKRMGIVGLGRIGKALARRAEAIGMRVAYHGRQPQPDVTYPHHADPVSLARESDVLAVCTPGGAATRGLISREALAALPPSAVLINIARGTVVDEAALVEALTSGRLAGAGLDVFADEPNVPEALLKLDNVVLTPHAASATVETRDAMAQLVVDNLAAHFAGKPLVTPVG
jgi:lactate dehydrogenase-like 2-hydroxyacid dehydrogenase